MKKMVVCVNELDQPSGVMEKMEAHQRGCLHRAFSIFIYNSEGEMLLQKRAADKYHSGGLWTNACCSHPAPEEVLEETIHSRLIEEMGFDCSLQEIHQFLYKANLDHGLVEHEYDHVFAGTYDGEILLNPEEADDYKWISVEKLTNDVRKHPESYTVWFRIALEKVIEICKK